jgi:uncharacterized protein involved in outer membrane biogenesis
MMNKVVRSVFLGLIIGVIFTLGLLIWFVKANEEFITAKLLSQLEKETTIQLTQQQIELSLWQHFPNVSLTIHDVVIPQPIDFNGANGARNMLEVEKLYLNTDLVPILLQRIQIKHIGVEAGQVNIVRNTAGKLNLNALFSKDKTGESSGKPLKIDAFLLHQVKVSYYQESSVFYMNHFFEEGRLSLNQSASDISLKFHLEGILQDLNSKGFVLEENVGVVYDGVFAGGDNNWEITDAQLTLDDVAFSVEGILNTDIPPEYEFVFSGNNISAKSMQPLLAKIGYDLPEELKIEKGEINIQGRLEALRPRPQMQVLIDFTGRKLQLFAGNNELRKGFFEGRISANTVTQKYRVELTRSNFQSLGGTFTGNVLLTRERNRRLSVALEGDMPLGSLLATVNNNLKTDAEGLIYLNYHYDGLFPEKPEELLLANNAKVTLAFQNNKLIVKAPYSLTLTELSGKISKQSSLYIDSVTGQIEGSKFFIDARLQDPELLTPENSRQNARISGVLKGDSLNTAWFKRSRKDAPAIKGSQTKKSHLFPDDITGSLSVHLGAFVHNTFLARNLHLMAHYKPGMLTLREVDLQTAGGNVRAGGVLMKKLNGNMALRAQGNFRQLHISDLFTSMNNFGQDFIRDDHLGGTLSGTLQLQTDLSGDGKISLPTLVTHSKVRIDNGELIGFEPLMGLSKFIDVQELKHIRFSTLENQVSIAHQLIRIPQMDINTSAFNITASGEHAFDREFDYHLKVLLSDVLSSRFKRRNNKKESFGAIEDDGLGNTAVYLRIQGNPDDYEVSYDRQAAREVMRQRVQQEKNVLKNILNQEFGWFDKDTTKVEQKSVGHKIEFEPEANKKKKKKEDKSKEKPVFNIVFEEDTTSKKK